jgi:arginase family enzyme
VAYCTTTDVYLETGAKLGTITITDVGDMIVKSDKEIITKLRNLGITTPPVSDDDLNTASIQLTIAKIKRRQAQELSRPNSLSLGGDISFSASPEAEAKAAEDKAQEAIERYVNVTGGSGVIIVPGRCNGGMF